MIVLNGKLLEQEMIHLDRGYLYGCGVFETLLIKGGNPLFLREHLERLNKGLKILNIPQSLQETYVYGELEKLEVKDCALRISVSDENIIFTKRPLTYKKEAYEKGFSLKVSDITRNPKSHMTYIKSLNYIDNGLERQKAIDEGFNEVLFLNGEGKVTEGSTTNLFFIKDDAIFTPSVECGLLEGVVRNWMIQHYPVTKGKFTLQQVIESEGVFITNSLMGLMKVSHIGDTAMRQHPMFLILQKEYNNFLEDQKHE